MKRRGYDIGRVVDLIFEYWLGRMKDSELEEYRHMKETTGLDKYAREFEDREWIKNALEEPDIFETDKAYRRFWSMTAGKRSIGRLRWRWVASLLIPLLVGGGVGLFVWWQPASLKKTVPGFSTTTDNWFILPNHRQQNHKSCTMN